MHRTRQPLQDIDAPTNAPEVESGLTLDTTAQGAYGNQFLQDQLRGGVDADARSCILVGPSPIFLPRPMFWPRIAPIVRPLAEPVVRPLIDPVPPLPMPVEGLNPEVGPKPESSTEDGGSDTLEQDKATEDAPAPEGPEVEAPSEMDSGKNDGQNRPKSTDDGPYPVPEPTPEVTPKDQYVPPEQLPPKAPPPPPFRLPRLFEPPDFT